MIYRKKQKRKNCETGSKKVRLRYYLSKSEANFLDEFGLNCKKSGGKKLTRKEIVNALIRTLKNNNILRILKKAM